MLGDVRRDQNQDTVVFFDRIKCDLSQLFHRLSGCQIAGRASSSWLAERCLIFANDNAKWLARAQSYFCKGLKECDLSRRMLVPGGYLCRSK